MISSLYEHQGQHAASRSGKYTKDGKGNAIPAHNIPMVVTGTLSLAFGWFGFNPGSTLAGTDTRLALVATNTMIASAAGAMTACIFRLDALRQAGRDDDLQWSLGGARGDLRARS